MGATRVAAIVVAACLLASALVAEEAARKADLTPHESVDSWGPFMPMRVVSRSGRHYAVLKARRGVWPGPFELVRRRDGAGPIEPYPPKDLSKLRGASENRDAEDTVLTGGTLPQLPMEAAVTEQPLGIVLFDQ
jgi:hypothetical protein